MLHLLLPPQNRYRREWWWLAWAWLGIGVLLVAGLWAEHRDIAQRERQRLTQQAGVIHDNLARQLVLIDKALAGLLDALPHTRALGDDLGRVQERVQAFADTMVGVGAIAWLDAQGQVLASNHSGLIGQDFSNRAYFQIARHRQVLNTLVVGAPFAPEPGLWVLPIVRPVVGVDGRFDGVVVMSLYPEDFATLLRSVLYAPDMYATVVHGQGQRFVWQNQSGSDTQERLRAPSGMLRQFLADGAPRAVLQGVLRPDEPERLVAIATVQPSALAMDQPLIAAVGRTVPAVFAPWRTMVGVAIVFYLLVGMVVASGLHLMQQHLRRQEQSLQDKGQALNNLWHAVLVATDQGVWDCNFATGQMYLSSAWKALLGYADEDIGTSVDEWMMRLHPDDGPRAQAAWEACQNGQDEYDCVYRLRCKDGSYRWSLCKGRVLTRDAQGRVLRIVGTNTDVSEERRLRERFEHLTQNVPGMIYQFQLEPDGTSHFPYVSKGGEDIYGFSADLLEPAGSKARSVIHPDDALRVAQSIVDSAQALTVWREEYRVRLQDRGERWVSGVARPQRLDGGAVLWHGYIHDITDRKRQAIELEETQRMLQHLIHAMPVALCMVDEARGIYFRNQRFLDYFGYTEAQVPSMDEWAVHAYPDPAYRSHVGREWRAALAHAATHDGYIPSQEYRIAAQSGQVLTMAIGGVQFGSSLLVTFVDRTAEQAYSETLEKMAFVDALTGLPNRRQFDQTLQSEWLRGQRSGQPLALLMIDIDFFKQYNDLYGHPGGDACLRAVAKVLRGAMGRSYDLVARYGGEEFVCLLPECTLEGASAKAQALCQAVRVLQLPHGGSKVGQHVTISVGVAALVPGAEQTSDQLLALADARLYCAKEAGRNRINDGSCEKVS
ncbi:MAG: diguanylate cyclase [Comamonas sp.]|nr:diguanylate cyclase [Comamonas sp.]